MKRSLLAILAFLFSGFTLPLHAADPPTAPILRIAPGAHTAKIGSIASDAAGRWLVTASDDKTAQVWDLASNRLLTTLRPPIGAGNEGKLYAVAMSPDGGAVAVGGWTSYEWDNSISIYLFDRASGRLLRRITGLPNVILHLAFAPDGRSLAASLFGNNGIRLFDLAEDPGWGALLAEDREYGDSSYSVSFSADGRRLVSTSFDGYLRLYRWNRGKPAEPLVLLTKARAPGGPHPFAARFAPDGKRIAVGFDDTPAVNVLDGTSLRLLAEAEATGLNGNLSSVAWSRDGAWLYAAGTVHKDGQRFIRRWAAPAGAPASNKAKRPDRLGVPQDWPVASGAIMELLALPGDSPWLAFVSGEPALGVLDGTGRRTLFHAPAVVDLRGLWGEAFTLSADGTQVRFGYEYGGQTPAVFDSLRRSLQPGSTAARALDAATPLHPPVTSAPGLKISDWEDTRTPRLNGQLLKLKQYERARSLAIRPGPGGKFDRSSPGFILGTGWNLRAFDRNGQVTWQQPVPSEVWGVNVSRDGRWVAAAYADGTIRWHRATDGVEQLAFYPHPDQKRWVLWTPGGYFDASPGAEDLIGWHVNNGKDAAADFYPASRFRARFHRPDIIDQVLQTLDEAKAVRQADAEAGRRTQSASIAQILPPVARILSPGEGERFSQSDVTLRYSVRTPADAPLTGVKVLLDGRPVETQRGLQRQEALAAATAGGEREYSLTLALPERDLTLSLIAENKNAASVASHVRLVWAGTKKPEFVAKPKLYVLAVGVSDYQDKSLKLKYPAKDARDFAAALQKQQGLYSEVVVKLLPDASSDAVLDGLDWLRQEVTAKDVGVLFLAGHGVNDADGDYYFLPANANPDRLRRTAVPYFEVKKTLSSLPGKTLGFIDTCHSGNVMGGKGGARRGVADINALVNDLTAAENGVVVFASSTGRQFSLENDEWQNGAFTKALVEGLNGKADYTKDGAISINELDTWLADRVKQLTKNQQTPTTTKPSSVPDFPVAAVR